VDAAPDDETATRIETEIRAVPGVRDVHDLRLRRSGGALRDDGHVTFDGHLTLSEAHRLTEAARARVCIAIPEVADILLHAEPDGHADGPAAHAAPLRPEIERMLRTELALRTDGVRLVELRLDYRDDSLTLGLVLDGPVPDEAGLRARLEAALKPSLGMPTTVLLNPPWPPRPRVFVNLALRPLSRLLDRQRAGAPPRRARNARSGVSVRQRAHARECLRHRFVERRVGLLAKARNELPIVEPERQAPEVAHLQ
jgi:hypothetical protein